MSADRRAPSVSVVMPVYNTRRFLRESARSVLTQTKADLELILVDNNSTDGSDEIIEELGASDDRVVCLSCEKPGAAPARNMAIKHARGRYIAFLDSDDLWLPEKLERQIAFMEKNSYVFTHTYYEKISMDGEKRIKVVERPAKLSYEDLLRSNQIGCLTAVYDSDALGKKPMPDIKARQDYGLWLDILKNQHAAYCVPEVLAKYRVNMSGSLSSNKYANVRHNWELFRNVEGMSVIRTAYYVGWNIFRKLKNW